MWAITVLVSLAALLVLLLCIPLDLALRFDSDRRPKFSMKLVWLFGLVRTEARRQKPAEKEVIAERKPKLGEQENVIRVIFKVLRTKDMPGQITHLLRSIFRHLKIRDLVANLKIGLDNPADTGLLFALIAPLSLFASFLPYQIKIEPSFTANFFLQGHFSGVIRTQPIHLVGSFIGFVFSLPVVRAVKTLALSKWRGR